MKVIELSERSRMPVFFLFSNIEALFDTGAEISVCNITAEMFELVFADNCRKLFRSSINGFGGKAEGTCYTVKHLEFGGMKFEDVPFFIPDEPTTRYKFIIAGTVLSDYPYCIDMHRHTLTVENE